MSSIRRLTCPTVYYDRLLMGLATKNDISYSKAVQYCVESYFKSQSKEVIQNYLSQPKIKVKHYTKNNY
jgi:hypothetical protein